MCIPCEEVKGHWVGIHKKWECAVWRSKGYVYGKGKENFGTKVIDGVCVYYFENFLKKTLRQIMLKILR